MNPVLSLLFLSLAVAKDSNERCGMLYQKWVAKFGKQQPFRAEAGKRMRNFCNNLESLRSSRNRFNALKSPFADMSPEEFSSFYHLKENAEYIRAEIGSQRWKGLRAMGRQLQDAPEEYSHHDQFPSRVSPVQDQGGCGSCWAFSIAGSCDGAVAMHHNISMNLSEAWLKDCARWTISGRETHGVCQGGMMPQVMHHMMLMDAVLPDESVTHAYEPVEYDGIPYEECKDPSEYTKGVKLMHYDQWTDHPGVQSTANEADMRAMMYLRGPIQVAVAANTLQFYDGSIISGEQCSDLNMNHAVVLTAYDTQKYTLKNSWGTAWGDNGYFYIAPGSECLGIGLRRYACITEPVNSSGPSPTTSQPGPTTAEPEPITTPQPQPTTSQPEPEPSPEPQCKCSIVPVDGDRGCRCLWYELKKGEKSHQEALKRCIKSDGFRFQRRWDQRDYEAWCQNQGRMLSFPDERPDLSPNPECEKFKEKGDKCEFIRCQFPNAERLQKRVCSKEGRALGLPDAPDFLDHLKPNPQCERFMERGDECAFIKCRLPNAERLHQWICSENRP